MDKKVFKLIGIVVIILVIIIGIMYLIDLDKMKKGEEVIFSTWGQKYAPELEITKNTELNSTISNYNKKYSKIVENIYIELDIPIEWKYEELQLNSDNNFYKYALKLYKDKREQYAVLYFYNNPFAVCGTGRTSENIILNNGKNATIGYYDGNIDWSDISFYNENKYIVIMNNGITGDDAKKVIEFIKTINIINDYNEIEVDLEV